MSLKRRLPKPFDWSLIAGISDETFGIPPDVVFQIMETGRLYEIKAHRMILGIVSPTFKTMFYTTQVGDKTVKEVKIEQTTGPAFQIMIDAIYDTKSIEDSLQDKSVKEVFDVVNLIEQFQIAQLKEHVEELLSDYPVADDTVLDVAAEAMEYATLFQKEAQQLLLCCAKFLKPKLKDADTIFTYAEENNDQKEVFAALLALMKGIKPKECSNCGYENCKNEEPVEDDELRVGLIVTANKAARGWGNPDRGKGKVTSVTATDIFVESITAGSTNLTFGDLYAKISSNGKRRGFLFSCE